MDSTLHERWQKQFGVQKENEQDEQGAFHPFESRLDWEVACWAIEEGIGHGALDRLLAIPGVTFEDNPNDEYNIYYRNPIDAIRSLLGNPVHAKDIVYRPKKIFRDHTKSVRIYNEIVQNRLPVGAALAPVIIATDKTQLTQFSSSKSAYPIYLTLGNIPRAIHRKPSQQAYFLLGYLSVDKILKDDLSSREVSSRTQRLFHDSLHIILEPLKIAGAEGVEITGGDGCVHLVFPVLACYVADYPEQCLVTCSKYARADELAELSQSAVQTQTWTMGIIEDAKSSTNTSSAFKTKCMEAGVRGGVFLPFWHGLLNEEELDACIRSLPPCYGLHHFKNGWSSLGQIGGKDCKHMAHILLGCMIGKVPRDVIISYRSLLDFIYLAQYPSHDDDTLAYMEKALKDFHRHKNILFNLGVREHLDIPKIHSLLHYVDSITWFGTTDNYNTEMMEQGWYTSNHCNEMPQMISWLSRREKVIFF
ncbi:hypothetical protein DFH29DRAFT_985579 [Suillus ampliporus]|nr:hypothetical protein DFH29DRAFT_985579 [Suillus ampliporus]